jgi:hypothetical protein
MIGKQMGLCVLLAMSLMIGGCGSDSEESSSSGSSSASGTGGASLSGAQAEARDAAMAEIQKHWMKTADGWTTAKLTGSPFAPQHILQQFKDFNIEEVESFNLNEADKLNGFEWAGQVSFKNSPAREAGDPGMAFDGMAGMTVDRAVGRWTQWLDYSPDSVRVQKVKGKWQVQDDSQLLTGTLPTPEDFAKAGVQ